MSFPIIEASSTTWNSSNTISHNINLPSGIVSGELLMAFIGNDSTSSVNSITSGWSLVPGVSSTLDLGGNVTGSVYYKVADGTEGATITVGLTGSSQSLASVVFRISGYGDFNGILGNTSNPPEVTNSFGLSDTLYIAFACYDAPSFYDDNIPTGYTLEANATGSSTSTGVVGCVTAIKEANSSRTTQVHLLFLMVL